MEAVDIKVVLVGAASVGKTCIVQRATSGQFNQSTTPTLGASYISKTMNVDDIRVNLQIWDTAGQERYKGMAPMYYRGAHVALVVFALDSLESFYSVDEWFESIESNTTSKVIYFLVGNKSDIQERTVSTEQGTQKAEQHGATFIEVSAKTGDGIDDLFVQIPKYYLESCTNTNKPDEKAVNLENQNGKSKGGCC